MKKSNTHKNSMKTDQMVNNAMTNQSNNIIVEGTSTAGNAVERKAKKKNKKTNEMDQNY